MSRTANQDLFWTRKGVLASSALSGLVCDNLCLIWWSSDSWLAPLYGGAITIRGKNWAKERGWYRAVRLVGDKLVQQHYVDEGYMSVVTWCGGLTLVTPPFQSCMLPCNVFQPHWPDPGTCPTLTLVTPIVWDQALSQYVAWPQVTSLVPRVMAPLAHCTMAKSCVNLWQNPFSPKILLSIWYVAQGFKFNTDLVAQYIKTVAQYVNMVAQYENMVAQYVNMVA